VTVEAIDWKDDPDGDAFEVRITGSADLDWRKNPDVNLREYKVSGSSSQTPGFPRREPGPNRDAPYAVPYPTFQRSVTEVVLPASGKGFTVRGPNGTDKVGGVELRRASAIEAGVARFTSEIRSLTPEISADEAEEATRTLRRLAAEDSLIRAPL
jgi:hypothetical protein